MSDSNIGWIDREKMKAALNALRSSQRPVVAPKTHTPDSDFVDLFGEQRSSPIPAADQSRGDFVQESASAQADRQVTDESLADIHPEQVRAIAREAAVDGRASSEQDLDETRSAFKDLQLRATGELQALHTPAARQDIAIEAAPSGQALTPTFELDADEDVFQDATTQSTPSPWETDVPAHGGTFDAPPESIPEASPIEAIESDSSRHPLADAFDVLRDANDAFEVRLSDQEVGYESAIPELTRPSTIEAVAEAAAPSPQGSEVSEEASETQQSPQTPVDVEPTTPFDDLDEDDEGGLSLPTGDLDLNLRSSMTSVASIQALPNARNTVNISESISFDDGDFGDQSSASPFDEFDIHPTPDDFETTAQPSDLPSLASATAQNVDADEYSFDESEGIALPRFDDEENDQDESGLALRPPPTHAVPFLTKVSSPAPSNWGRSALSSVTREVPALSIDAAQPRTSTIQSAENALTGAPPSQASSSELVNEPKIEEGLLASLRFKNSPPPKDYPSVLYWLEALAAWCMDAGLVDGLFVADESGLGLINTTISEGEIAVAVAMRQSMATLHRLHNEEAPGFTAFRHGAKQYMNLLWTPTNHGVLTVGILSEAPQHDERLTLLLERLIRAVETLPLVD